MTNGSNPKKERLDPGMVQRRASDPTSSVWVSASAGTGKTKVLTDRVLRLMLNGATPDQILCLTFTRAAASLMTNRIRDELSLWATCDDATLATRLTKLNGRKPAPETVTRARQMFAEFLDAHGGMRIQTIHSFAQSLLRRFPIESGIPPYFDVMDDQTAAELLREAQADVLKQIQKDPNSALARAVNAITPEVSEDDFVSLITELTYRRGQLIGLIEAHGGIEGTIDGVYKHLKTPRSMTAAKLLTALNADTGLGKKAPNIDALRHAAEILSTGTDAERTKAATLQQWINGSPTERAALFAEYKSIFLTTEETPRKRMTTKATIAAEASLTDEAARLVDGLDKIMSAHVAQYTESILRMSDAIMEHYNEKKRALNLLDYDDLVHRANTMMQEDGAASWALEKLPGKINHILVDEAQDTNPDQWRLIASLTEELFKPRRGRKSDSTIFVVGDEKQSIFSFQRADPEEFGARKKFFADLVTQARGKWRDIDMEIAFRSTPAITQTVDAVFANPEASDGLFHESEAAERRVRHNPFRRGQGGVVEVHPLVKASPKKDPEPWSLPIAGESGEDPGIALADKIADQIKDWLDRGEILESRNRPMNAGDILILVRRRSAFVDHVIRALKKRDVPVAGADRMSLRDQIAVMDMTALGEICLFPRDDYKLACVLKSPLIGMTDQQLEDLAINRTGNLWEALEAKSKEANAKPVYAAAFAYLDTLRNKAGALRPYEFYTTLLMAPCPANDKSALNAFYGRLGFEAEDPLTEFMNALERFEQSHIPSMQGFLSWLDAGEAEVKRDAGLDRDNPRVQIMTVHGAKGLEAPVVIMPDTTGTPSDNVHAKPRFLWPEGGRKVPLWVPRSALESSLYRAEREKIELLRDREFRRLLYVALTRPADRLYVFGTQGSKDISPKSWYSLIKTGLEEGLKGQIKKIPANQNTDAPDTTVFNEDDLILQFCAAQSAKPSPDNVAPVAKGKAVGIPAWARVAPKADATSSTPFRPSDYTGRAASTTRRAPSPLDAATDGYFMQLGVLVHDLLEYLPTLPADTRETAAAEYLAKPGWKLSQEAQAQTLEQVMAVINDPAFGLLFGSNSRAEIPLTGFIMRNGEKKLFSAQIDRLVVDGDSILIVDYKNSQNVPNTAAQVSYQYIVQMASYRLALQQLYPGKQVKCALLYTRTASLIALPDAMLDRAVEKNGLAPCVQKTPRKPAP